MWITPINIVDVIIYALLFAAWEKNTVPPHFTIYDVNNTEDKQKKLIANQSIDNEDYMTQSRR